MSPTVIRYSTLALVLCLPLSTANGGHSYSGNLDFKRMGWDAAFGDPDIVHNDWIRAGYWVRIAAANVPSPEHGANVSSATAMSLRPLTDDDDYSHSLSSTSRHGLGYTTHEMSIDDNQKPLGPNQPSQEDIQPSWGPDDDIKDICVTVYHLGKEAQARARYDPGDCRSFLSDDYVEFTVEYDAFWAYRGDAHDPADESALVAAQEAVVPVVWHTTRYMPGGDGREYTGTSPWCYRAGSPPPRTRPTPTQAPVVTVTVTAASMPTATGRARHVVGAAALALALVVV
ncbi:hypothetical protein PG985_010283 [Apiospora marii]|uniref:uncharacterized protein n=1 Tax=Apiospora marii TaxID=335849 RepID=UPI0031325C47